MKQAQSVIPHIITVLITGKQHQRQVAALELSLMQAATPLFETRVIDKRQQKWLV